MAKTKTKFMCSSCGYESLKWMGRCPGCNEWNTMHEEREAPEVKGRLKHSIPHQKQERAIPISEVRAVSQPRVSTGMMELNRVLGGGVVPGSMILVGGDPGIGKSTLLLQSTNQMALKGLSILYVSGEESVAQIRLRAERLEALSDQLMVASETNLRAIEKMLEENKPDLMVIDSIQTMHHPEITSAPGSVSQVRECTGEFMRLAKECGITIIIVGHVTKQGAIAGPRMLEHMVDCVLYFEGEQHHTFRVLRAVKNRFGSTNEIGVFEMKESGLSEVENPSEIFLSGRPLGVPGTCVAASVEGTRPLLVELQALVTPSSFAIPKRMSAGIDYQRVTMLLAVLEKRIGLNLQNQDAYLNVVGGIRISEPAVDLAVAVTLASSFREKSTGSHDLFIGEVGLTGEVRGVSRIEQRVTEAYTMGFTRIILPKRNLSQVKVENVDLVGVQSLEEALRVGLG